MCINPSKFFKKKKYSSRVDFHEVWNQVNMLKELELKRKSFIFIFLNHIEEFFFVPKLYNT